MDKSKLLSQSALFATLSEEEVGELAGLASDVAYNARDVVFEKGSIGDQLFVLASGRVSLELKGKDGKAIALGTLGDGDMFGELAVLDGSKRSATVIATAPSTLLAIQRSDLFGLMHRFPGIAIKLLQVLAERIRMTDELIEDTLAFNLPAKVAKDLLGLAKAYGQNTSNGLKITVDFSQSELAGIVGTTEQKLDELLKQWEQEGLIAQSRGYITILDVHKLKGLT